MKNYCTSNRHLLTIANLICLSFFFLNCSTPRKQQPTLTQAELLKKTREMYYSLNKLGLKRLRANAHPNLEAMLSSMDEPRRDSVKSVLGQIHILLTLDSLGNPTVTHEPDIPAIEKRSTYVKVVNGWETMLSGFFRSWKVYAVDTPFPEPNSAYQMQNKDGKYIISAKEGGLSSNSTLSEDLTIEEVSINSSTSVNMVMHPHFTKNPHGLLVSELDGNYGKKPFSMQAEYQEVQGLELPKTLKFTSGSDEFEWTLTDYVIDKR